MAAQLLPRVGPKPLIVSGAGFLFAAAVVALFMLKVGKEAVFEDDAPLQVG